jgi:FkbM family methyltransferase
MQPEPDLIFDLGANRGEDTEFYLAKGFRVVAVEANPVLHAELAGRLAAPIAAGRLVLLNIGIWQTPGSLTFYANDDNDHWSSFDPAYGTRQGTRYHTLPVPCRTMPDLVAEHGLPHYMKIDIEGADRFVVDQLGTLAGLPDFVSIEEYGVAAIDGLAAAGFTRFQCLPQYNKTWAVPPDPAREGSFAPRVSTGYDSGLFGAELPGAWLPTAEARAHYLAAIRDETWTYRGPPNEWWDIHAAR